MTQNQKQDVTGRQGGRNRNRGRGRDHRRPVNVQARTSLTDPAAYAPEALKQAAAAFRGDATRVFRPGVERLTAVTWVTLADYTPGPNNKATPANSVGIFMDEIAAYPSAQVAALTVGFTGYLDPQTGVPQVATVVAPVTWAAADGRFVAGREAIAARVVTAEKAGRRRGRRRVRYAAQGVFDPITEARWCNAAMFLGWQLMTVLVRDWRVNSVPRGPRATLYNPGGPDADGAAQPRLDPAPAVITNEQSDMVCLSFRGQPPGVDLTGVFPAPVPGTAPWYVIGQNVGAIDYEVSEHLGIRYAIGG